MADQTKLQELRDKGSTALVSDALDARDCRNQAMDSRLVRTAGPDRLIGRAATILAGEEGALPERPYEQQIAATDMLAEGDVPVVNTQGCTSCAFWGELFATAALARGARGAVVDGLIRDVSKLDALGVPVFATGTRPIDSMGRLTVHSWNRPIRCGGVLVNPGDIVFGDEDGVIVIPSHLADEVIDSALEKAGKEDAMRADLRAGVSLTEAWARHRVL